MAEFKSRWRCIGNRTNGLYHLLPWWMHWHNLLVIFLKLKSDWGLATFLHARSFNIASTNRSLFSCHVRDKWKRQSILCLSVRGDIRSLGTRINVYYYSHYARNLVIFLLSPTYVLNHDSVHILMYVIISTHWNSANNNHHSFKDWFQIMNEKKKNERE